MAQVAAMVEMIAVESKEHLKISSVACIYNRRCFVLLARMSIMSILPRQRGESMYYISTPSY